MPDDGRLRPPATRLLKGDESIAGASVTLRDFWSWAMSDLRTNTVRPMLAEFLVAQALGAASRPRIEWDAYDVETPSGVRVEVKSSAYLQAWEQAAPSVVRFGGLKGRVAGDAGMRAPDQTFNADVYVFALITTRDHASYDPLDLAQWSFWVLPRSVIAEANQSSLGLKGIEALADGAVSYEDLDAAVTRASQQN